MKLLKRNLSKFSQPSCSWKRTLARKVPVNVAYGEGDPCCICFGAEDEALMKIKYFRGHEGGWVFRRDHQQQPTIFDDNSEITDTSEVVGLHLWALWRPAFASFLADIRYMPAAIGASRTSLSRICRESLHLPTHPRLDMHGLAVLACLLVSCSRKKLPKNKSTKRCFCDTVRDQSYSLPLWQRG